ncbi:MAG: hypothetical protein SOX74_01720 [Candidatus Faecousia sp.]|uniref:IS1/IS1595 family N-terminal zinc-binding domain-containing protein n=1 Tax=Faecousia sp. TaxID=2952921 RepID=UPI002A8509B5|nr:hypothetical protein [Candidatus Faecousia sp.]
MPYLLFFFHNSSMGRKTKKQRAIELLQQLNQEDLKEVLDAFDVGSPNNSYENVEKLLRKECPNCHSTNHTKKGKNKLGLTRYRCKDCGRTYSILTDTPLENTQYDWNVWVTVLEKMLTNQSIKETRKYLVKNKLVDDIDILTVSAMCNKLRNSFIYMPLPTLSGNVQCDEKHFHESQKGVKDPIDVLDDTGKTRREARERTKSSKYGSMGPEFATICCAVDSSGHSVAKVVSMGRMELEDFEDNIAIHFGDVAFLCTDMNPIYTQYASIHKLSQYVQNSEIHKLIAQCDTAKKKQAAYEQNKLDYIVGAGIMSYDKMCKFRNDNKLTINAVNGYHSGLERYINYIARGVSTKHLQAWVSFYNYRNNFRVDHGYSPSVYEDAEVILIELLKLRIPIRVEDIKYQKDLTKKQPKRYTKKFIAATVAARIKSNNPYIKFSEEDGMWVVDKRTSINLLPEYKRRELAKALKIKPFSPIAVSSADLKKKLLAHPDLEDALYVLANGHTEDYR